jgi:hypothetical protein
MTPRDPPLRRAAVKLLAAIGALAASIAALVVVIDLVRGVLG